MSLKRLVSMSRPKRKIFLAMWANNQFSLSLDQSHVSALENTVRWKISNNIIYQRSVQNFLNNIYLNGLMSVKPESANIISVK